MSESEEKPDGKSYPITTLKDIFNLPTLRQVQTCLVEIGESMVMAKAADGIVVEMMRQNGHEVPRATEWPDVLDWRDDGKGECGFKVVDPTGSAPEIDFGTVVIKKEGA